MEACLTHQKVRLDGVALHQVGLQTLDQVGQALHHGAIEPALFRNGIDGQRQLPGGFNEEPGPALALEDRNRDVDAPRRLPRMSDTRELQQIFSRTGDGESFDDRQEPDRLGHRIHRKNAAIRSTTKSMSSEVNSGYTGKARTRLVSSSLTGKSPSR